MRAVKLLSYLLLTVGSVVMLFPFLWMLLTSLKPLAEIFNLTLFPESPTLDNYRFEKHRESMGLKHMGSWL